MRDDDGGDGSATTAHDDDGSATTTPDDARRRPTTPDDARRRPTTPDDDARRRRRRFGDDLATGWAADYADPMGSINYFDTFIAVSPDSTAETGMVPAERAAPSVAGLTHRMISEHPYEYTCDDVLFSVYADRRGIPEAERAAAREQFFAKSRACFRASDLGKKYGWGIHCDAEGRAALYAVDSSDYAQFVSGERQTDAGGPVGVKQAMRSRR